MEKQYNHTKKLVLGVLVVVMSMTDLLFGASRAAAASNQPAAKAPAVIYSDNLAANWQNWSWNSTVSLNSRSPVQSGSAAISVKSTAGWSGFYLHRDAGLSTAGYTHLEFYLNGGSTGGQKLQVIANKSTSKIYGVTAAKNQWTKVDVPLANLGSPAALNDLYVQNATDRAQAVISLDTIQLVDLSTGAATLTPTRAANPTATKPGPTATKAAPTATRPAPTATRAAPTATVSAGGKFVTLPPGSALPSDAACAAAVKRKAENKKSNATYNATKGNQSLGSSFFPTSDDPKANSQIAPRVTGNFTGTTDEILQWTACKWGIDEDMVRAQAAVESWWRQDTKGDWTSDSSRCAPGHGLGVDGKAGQCPESFGILQNRYPYEQASWPGINNSTAFNADTAYAIWRTCYEGYEYWLNDVDHGKTYGAGDAWGCMGRWFAGRWYTADANTYIGRVQDYLNQRIWETASFQEP